MPTRFYMENTTASPLNALAFDSGWEQTGGAADRRFAPRKTQTSTVSALANQTALTVPITTTQQILSRQYCTEPIPYRTRIEGTFSMVLRGLENATTNNVFLAYVLRVVSIDGGTVRGTLASSMTNAGTEFVATAATRIFSAVALSALTCEAGDRLILEIGGHAQAPSVAGSYTYRYGNSAASDFALTSALTTDLNPWWELSMDLFQSGSVNQLNQGRI